MLIEQRKGLQKGEQSSRILKERAELDLIRSMGEKQMGEGQVGPTKVSMRCTYVSSV